MKSWKPLQRLLVLFLINLAIMFGVNSLFNYAWPDDEKKSLVAVFVQSFTTAGFLTLFFEWRFVKQAFSKKDKKDE